SNVDLPLRVPVAACRDVPGRRQRRGHVVCTGQQLRVVQRDHLLRRGMSVPDPSAVDWVPLFGTGTSSTPGGPAARIWRSTVQAIPSGAWTPVSFDTVRYDNAAQWVVGSPTRLTCKQPGTYQIAGTIQLASQAAAGNVRQTAIRLNGSVMLAI